MNPKEQAQIQQELGQWEYEISFPDHTLHVKLERSDCDMELRLPDPDKEVTIVARPNGFQLFSHYKNEIRKDFAVSGSNIISIQLLPSFTISNEAAISVKYVILSLVMFGLAGAITSEGPMLALWLLLGLAFGLILSLIFKKSFRQNLLMNIIDEGQQRYLLFSIDKKDKETCTRFFTRFIQDKFTC